MNKLTNTLKTIIATHGIEILENEQRLNAIIADMFAHDKKTAKLLALSVKEKTPQKILTLLKRNDVDITTHLLAIKQELIEDAFLNENAAKNIVEYWQEALKQLIVDGNAHKCEIKSEKFDEILEALDDFLFDGETPSIENFENEIKELKDLSNFDLASYYANEIFKKRYTNLLIDYDLDTTSGLIPGVPKSDIKTVTKVLDRMDTFDVEEMFHTLPIPKGIFVQTVKDRVVEAIVTGEKNSNTIVESDVEVTNNIDHLKNKIFIELQDFLRENTNWKGKSQDLFDEGKNIKDFSYYKQVMSAMQSYFYDSKKFDLINSYTKNKPIPNIANATSTQINAYNLTVFLNNFDSTITTYFRDILKINSADYGNLQSNFVKGSKYIRNIEALKNPYWVAGSHSSDGSGFEESDFTKLLVSKIPLYDKDEIKTNKSLTMNHIYILAWKVFNFEVEYGVKNKMINKKFNCLYENPQKQLLIYFDDILNGNKSELRNIFSDVLDYVYSIQIYLTSKEPNIHERENNNNFSISGVISQIIMNCCGGYYLKYVANGNYQKLHLPYFKQFIKMKFRDIVYNKFVGYHFPIDIEIYRQELKQLYINDFNWFSQNTTQSDIIEFIRRLIGVNLNSHKAIDCLLYELNVKNPDLFTPNQINMLNMKFNEFINAIIIDKLRIRAELHFSIPTYMSIENDLLLERYINSTISHPVFKAIEKVYLSLYGYELIDDLKLNCQVLSPKKKTYKASINTGRDLGMTIIELEPFYSNKKK